MTRSATRTSSKIIMQCPFCRKKGPKELVEGPKRFNGCAAAAVIVLAIPTCGLSLILLLVLLLAKPGSVLRQMRRIVCSARLTRPRFRDIIQVYSR